MWRLLFQELREVLWLASIVGGLSLIGIALAAAFVSGALQGLLAGSLGLN